MSCYEKWGVIEIGGGKDEGGFGKKVDGGLVRLGLLVEFASLLGIWRTV
jgi:hypothetical protein